MSEIRSICNLSDEDLEARRKALRKGLARRVRGRETLSDGLALLFDHTPELREELDAFVDFERECCPGLGFELSEEAGRLRLEISGIDPAASVFADLGEAGELRGPKRRGWPRLLRSTGLGVAGSLLLCCVVPIGLAAVVGAAPLAMLDDPWVIGVVALVLAVLFWRFERRREVARTERASAGECGC